MNILFTDIDGTILDEDKPLHPNNFKYMKYYQQQGNLIVITTGRNLFECKDILKTLSIPYDYLILNNGAYILDKHLNVIYEKLIDKNIGIIILDIISNIEGIWSYYCDGYNNYAYYDKHTYLRNGYNNNLVYKDFKSLYTNADGFQIICFNQDNKQTNIINKVIKQIESLNLDIEIQPNDIYVDIIPSNCNKGKGIKRLLDLIPDKIDKTIAIGDSFNDISMFKVVDKAITFDYSDKKVKEYSDMIVSYLYEIFEGEL